MDQPEPVEFKALSMLENEYAPTRHGRAPYWRPTPAKPWRDIHCPAWNWVHPEYTGREGLDLTTLDVNAAFLAAAGNAKFAHGKLEHTGPGTPEKVTTPGYYQIDSHAWQYPGIVHPLGSVNFEGPFSRVWVTAPTLELLSQLVEEEGSPWPDLTVYDSWTCATSVSLYDWAQAINAHRGAAIHAKWAAKEADNDLALIAAQGRYNAIKTGYSQAVQLMLGPAPGDQAKSGVKRPDWYHTIHAAHAALTWRKVWHGIRAGYTPVMMGSVDEVTYVMTDAIALHGKGILKIDTTGIKLGSFKIKHRENADA